jgi:hypothetical protein
MLLEHPSLLHQLWNKGVDIAAGVITSVFVGVIGLAGWRVKLELDKRHRKAILEVEASHANRISKEATRAHLDELSRERNAFVDAMTKAAPTTHEMKAVWERYTSWLVGNHLESNPGNLPILSAGPRAFQFIAHETNMNDRARELCELIRKTELSTNPVKEDS